MGVCGGLSVMTFGTTKMHKLCAVSWAFHMLWQRYRHQYFVQGRVPSGWTMWNAMGQRVTLGSASVLP